MSDRRNARLVIKSSSRLPMTVIVHPHARHPVLRLPVLGAFVGVLLLAGIALKIVELRADASRYDEAAATTMHGEADVIRRAGPSSREVGELLRVIAGRAGTTRAALVDDRLRVVATGTTTLPVGSPVGDPVVARVLTRGGLAMASGGRRALAVELGGRRYAYVVTRRRLTPPKAVGPADIPFVLAALVLAGALVIRRRRLSPANQLGAHRDAPDRAGPRDGARDPPRRGPLAHPPAGRRPPRPPHPRPRRADPPGRPARRPRVPRRPRRLRRPAPPDRPRGRGRGRPPRDAPPLPRRRAAARRGRVAAARPGRRRAARRRHGRPRRRTRVRHRPPSSIRPASSSPSPPIAPPRWTSSSPRAT